MTTRVTRASKKAAPKAAPRRGRPPGPGRKKAAPKKKVARRKAAPKKPEKLETLEELPRRRGAPKGNQFWKMRSSHGRKPKFATPEILWEACQEYFEWAEENPLWEAKAFAFQGDVTVEKLPKMRAMTLDGLHLFLDIDNETWRNYRGRKGFVGVTTRVENVIRSQKFAGAAAELLNPNIIARDLGLAEKREHAGHGGGAIVSAVIAPDLSSDEATKQYHELIRGGKNKR